MSMKVLMENMRMLGDRYSFNLLFENYERGVFSESQTVIIWESHIMQEANMLLDEGMVDILKKGYQKGKALAGKAKALYHKAVQKITSFVGKLADQALKLIVKGQMMAGRIIGILKSIYGKISSWCGAHPILCRTVKIILAMIAVTAAMMIFSNVAHADVDTSALSGKKPGSTQLTDTGLEAVKGFLGGASEDQDPETKQIYYDAYKWLENAHSSGETVDIKDGPKILQKAMKVLYKSVEEEPDMLDFYLDLGKKVKETAWEQTTQITAGGKTSFKHVTGQGLKIVKETV